jgi:molybdopterin converting factor small subunit
VTGLAVRVVLPAHLKTLAQVSGEVILALDGDVTPASLIDALEESYPALRGTIRDPATGRRRPFVRFFACEEDVSHSALDESLPPTVINGTEPFCIIGAMAGGEPIWRRRRRVSATPQRDEFLNR